MTFIIKQIIYGGYNKRIPEQVIGEYLDKYYQSGDRWDIIKAFDEWLDTHKRRGKNG